MDTVTLHTALPDVAAGAPAPEWLHLVPAGTVRGADGRGPYTLRDAAAVMQASMAAGKIALDENHSTDRGVGHPHPARGWIDRMEARDDGIWGHVEWTPSGTQLMAERAYRGISPVIRHSADGVISRVLRASLTNVGNLPLTTLHSQENSVDLPALRAALGLPETADEAACLARVQENKTFVSTHSQAVAAIAAAAGVTATDKEGLITALQTQRAGAGDLVGKVVSLQTRLDTVTAERAREKAVAFVDGAIRAGKPIAALRDHYVTCHAQDPVRIEMEIGKLPSINAGGITQAQVETLHATQGDSMGDEPTEAEVMMAKRMGHDPKKLVEQRKKDSETMASRRGF